MLYFFLHVTATTYTYTIAYTLSLHDALPIYLVSTVIKYDIIFENQFSGETYTKSLTRQTTGYPFEPPRDGSYQMTGSWFNEAIDLSNINDGNYTVYVRARSGDFETKLVLRDAYFNSKLARRFSIDGVGYQFRLNYYDRNLPLEFWVRKNGLISSTNTPTIDNMYNQVHEIKLVGSKLNIVGTSHNVKGNYAANQTVTRQIHLEKISDVSIAKTYNVGSITNGIYKVELAVSDGLEKTRAWYNTTLDISTLPIGEYAIIVQTKTGNIDDFGELYDIMFKQTNTSSIEGNRKYSIIKDETNRFRLLLKVEY